MGRQFQIQPAMRYGGLFCGLFAGEPGFRVDYGQFTLTVRVEGPTTVPLGGELDRKSEGSVMDITGVSSGSNLYPAGIGRGRGNQAHQQMHDLGAALKLGDLSGAKAAFSALQQQFRGAGPAGQRADLSPGGRNPVGTDLEALDKALQAGDLASARDAFSQARKDVHAVGKAHHHAAQADAALSTGGGTSSFALPGGSAGGAPGGSAAMDSDGDRDGTTGKTIDITA